MSEQQPGLRPSFERHVQTFLGAILVALVLWVGTTVTENSGEIVRMQEQTKALADKVEEVKAELRKATGAVSQVPYLEDRLQRVERRVQRLEEGRAPHP